MTIKRTKQSIHPVTCENIKCKCKWQFEYHYKVIKLLETY